jgi:aminoglycoside 3-N-acetyltransferase
MDYSTVESLTGPRSWWEAIRHESPSFDAACTPASRWMGRIAELVRTWPGARRSDHPQVSFAAAGPQAAAVTAGHSLDGGLGERGVVCWGGGGLPGPAGA